VNEFQTYKTTRNILESIKNVGMYIRKSRGDAQEDLQKHRMIMEEICKQNNWNFVEYSEIGTGDSIEDRVEIKELLKDVAEGLFDAVIVFDYDRLGRGNGTDQDTIKNTFRNSDTLIIVSNPFQIFDTNDERDEEAMDFKGFMARREYKMITKRMVTGKKIGLKMGRWSNGVAPFGYEYSKELKSLTVHPLESEIYKKLIVSEYINGKSITDIAWDLNKKNIASPRNGKWTPNTISNMLKSEVYLGHIVYNKSEGSRKSNSQTKKPFKQKPKEEWITIKNCHTSLKTQTEHLKIISLLKSKTRHNNHSINALTGLVKCYECGGTLKTQKVNNKVVLRNCTACKDSHGGDTSLIEKTIFDTISHLRDILINTKNSNANETEKEYILNQVKSLERELDVNEAAIEKIENAYEEGEYDINKFRKKVKARQENILELEENLKVKKLELSSFSNVDNEERIQRIDVFFEQIKKCKNNKEMNESYKSIISSIVWKRTIWDEVRVTVNFL